MARVSLPVPRLTGKKRRDPREWVREDSAPTAMKAGIVGGRAAREAILVCPGNRDVGYGWEAGGIRFRLGAACGLPGWCDRGIYIYHTNLYISEN